MSKDIGTITPYPIVQMCWVVDDMDTAALQWVKTVGAGPFFRIPQIQIDELTYRGKAATLDQSSAVCAGAAPEIQRAGEHRNRCPDPCGDRKLHPRRRSTPDA